MISSISITSGPSGVQRKQTRHCRLIRMEYCPRRSPFNASSRLPGGESKSSRRVAASTISSLRRTTASLLRQRAGQVPSRNSRSVALSAKLRIMSDSMWYVPRNSQGAVSPFEATGPRQVARPGMTSEFGFKMAAKQKNPGIAAGVLHLLRSPERRIRNPCRPCRRPEACRRRLHRCSSSALRRPWLRW